MTSASVLSTEVGTTVYASDPGGRHSSRRRWSYSPSQWSMRSAWWPSASSAEPSLGRAPCLPPLSMICVPSMISRDPSSLVMRKSYVPADSTFRYAVTSVTNLPLSPKSPAVVQSIVGFSSSTLGVCPGLSVQKSSSAICTSKTRMVTPGSWGGMSGGWAAAWPWTRVERNTAETSTAKRRMGVPPWGPRQPHGRWLTGCRTSVKGSLRRKGNRPTSAFYFIVVHTMGARSSLIVFAPCFDLRKWQLRHCLPTIESAV